MKNIVLFLLSAVLISLTSCTKPVKKMNQTGNVIFLHPDGTGATSWHAARILNYGPDGYLNWDRLSNMALYRSHMKDCLTASSHGGATTHAYGVKVKKDSYGLDGKDEITAASGKKMSIMDEAMEAGMKTALINSGSIIEPGTGCFVVSTESRRNYEEITKQIVESSVDIIFSGGEEWLLPEGVKGVHCEGQRKDGLNLIEYLKENGYTIVYNRKELLSTPPTTEKLFGVFSENHTFNDETEEYLRENKLPLYDKDAPTLAEMTKIALDILSASGKQFFAVIEEEATDNFANYNNARGVVEAVRRADEAIGVIGSFIDSNPNTLLITAADSEAGGLDMLGGVYTKIDQNYKVPVQGENGAPMDGIDGAGTTVWLSKSDQFGHQLPFAFAWATYDDAYGAVIAKGHGLNSEMVTGLLDNTDIYRIMYKTLFGKKLK
ncbi:MAG: alkaline phosphatase [Ignavibacteria bacterium]|jgi:alkaline phosphatase